MYQIRQRLSDQRALRRPVSGSGGASDWRRPARSAAAREKVPQAGVARRGRRAAHIDHVCAHGAGQSRLSRRHGRLLHLADDARRRLHPLRQPSAGRHRRPPATQRTKSVISILFGIDISSYIYVYIVICRLPRCAVTETPTTDATRRDECFKKAPIPIPEQLN